MCAILQGFPFLLAGHGCTARPHRTGLLTGRGVRAPDRASVFLRLRIQGRYWHDALPKQPLFGLRVILHGQKHGQVLHWSRPCHSGTCRVARWKYLPDVLPGRKCDNWRPACFFNAASFPWAIGCRGNFPGMKRVLLPSTPALMPSWPFLRWHVTTLIWAC